MARTIKINVNIVYCNLAEEFIEKFPLPKLGGKHRIINNIFGYYVQSHIPWRKLTAVVL
jgi:hypothetical protein